MHLLKPLLALLFPQSCLHCTQRCKNYLCAECLDELLLLDVHSHCLKCTRPLEEGECLVCLRCRVRRRGWKIALFDRFSPAASMRNLRSPNLVKAYAGLFTWQLEMMGWPRPQLVLPLGHTKSRIHAVALVFAKIHRAKVMTPWEKRGKIKFGCAKLLYQAAYQKTIYLLAEDARYTDAWLKTLRPFGAKSLFSLSILAS